jgi:hypothetical protein
LTFYKQCQSTTRIQTAANFRNKHEKCGHWPLDTQWNNQPGLENGILKQDPTIGRCSLCLYSFVSPLKKAKGESSINKWGNWER